MIACRTTKTFWADSTAYLINRGPSIPLKFKLLEEVWSGKEVNLSFLKLFCCVAYVQSENRDKLDQKVVKCYFIGYVL